MSSSHKYPVIYTFHDDLAGVPTREWGTSWRNSWFTADKKDGGWYTEVDRLHANNDLLEAWKVAWYKAGWNPKVLTLEDARKNFGFFDLISSLLDDLNLEESEKSYFYGLVAMANTDGGFMSEPDVLPLHINPAFGKDLPNQGQFTIYDSDRFSMASGTKLEWNTALQFLVLFLHLNRSNEFDHSGYVDLLESRHAVVQQEVVTGCAYRDISIVECEKYPIEMKVVKFSGPERGDCILGGWLEAELKSLHGKFSRLSFKFVKSEDLKLKEYEDFSPYMHQDPHWKLYDIMTLDNIKHVEVKISGEVLGNIIDVFEMHKSRVALNFMERLYNQCPIQ